MITHIHVFGVLDDDHPRRYIIFYDSGKTKTCTGQENLPKSAKQFIHRAKDTDCYKTSITGEVYHCIK